MAFRTARVIRASLEAGVAEIPADEAALRILDRPYLDWVRDARAVYWALGETVHPAGTPLCDAHPIVWDEASAALRRVHDGPGSGP